MAASARVTVASNMPGRLRSFSSRRMCSNKRGLALSGIESEKLRGKICRADFCLPVRVMRFQLSSRKIKCFANPLLARRSIKTLHFGKQ